MEGVVDPWIREILTSYGQLNYCVTEFIRVTHQIIPDHVFYDYAPELCSDSRTSAQTPVFAQLLGSDIEFMALNAAKAAELGSYGIDLNFGCPAKTVNRHDGGSVLLKDPSRVFNVTKAVRKAVPAHIPVNAKVRLGFENKDYHKEIAIAAEEAGAGWLAVHARTKVEGYKPPAHWEYIRWMKESVKIPVIANGEIWTVDDYHKCREVSGCEDVMIGRGFMAEPLLAQMIKNENLLSREERIKFYLRDYVMKYIEICPRTETRFLIGRTKQLVKLLCRNYDEIKPLFDKLKLAQNMFEIQLVLDEFILQTKWKAGISI